MENKASPKWYRVNADLRHLRNTIKYFDKFLFDNYIKKYCSGATLYELSVLCEDASRRTGTEYKANISLQTPIEHFLHDNTFLSSIWFDVGTGHIDIQKYLKHIYKMHHNFIQQYEKYSDTQTNNDNERLINNKQNEVTKMLLFLHFYLLGGNLKYLSLFDLTYKQSSVNYLLNKYGKILNYMRLIIILHIRQEIYDFMLAFTFQKDKYDIDYIPRVLYEQLYNIKQNSLYFMIMSYEDKRHAFFSKIKNVLEKEQFDDMTQYKEISELYNMLYTYVRNNTLFKNSSSSIYWMQLYADIKKQDVMGMLRRWRSKQVKIQTFEEAFKQFVQSNFTANIVFADLFDKNTKKELLLFAQNAIQMLVEYINDLRKKRNNALALLAHKLHVPLSLLISLSRQTNKVRGLQRHTFKYLFVYFALKYIDNTWANITVDDEDILENDDIGYILSIIDYYAKKHIKKYNKHSQRIPQEGDVE